jgi:hypothetical protein
VSAAQVLSVSAVAVSLRGDLVCALNVRASAVLVAYLRDRGTNVTTLVGADDAVNVASTKRCDATSSRRALAAVAALRELVDALAAHAAAGGAAGGVDHGAHDVASGAFGPRALRADRRAIDATVSTSGVDFGLRVVVVAPVNDTAAAANATGAGLAAAAAAPPWPRRRAFFDWVPG